LPESLRRRRPVRQLRPEHHRPDPERAGLCLLPQRLRRRLPVAPRHHSPAPTHAVPRRLNHEAAASRRPKETRFMIRNALSAAGLFAAAGIAHAQCLPDFLNAGDPQTAAYNGSSLAMQGDYFLSGCPGKTTGGHLNAGEVYAYSTISGTWGQVTHMTPSDPT